MDYDEKSEKILAAIKSRVPQLAALLAQAHDHWGVEDMVYRFYHTSFKVYRAQDITLKIWAELVAIGQEAGGLELDPRFARIVQAGTGHVFSTGHNADWDLRGRPIVEALFHSVFFLEQVCKYGLLPRSPEVLPSGVAAVHTLYQIR